MLATAIKTSLNLTEDFETKVLPLSADDEGINIATLISSKQNLGNRKTVLYIHGYVDYFFHPHVAEAFHAQGMDFFALDIRKYGRSILPHQTPNFCNSLEEYFEEIDIALEEIQQHTNQDIYVLAHSTGCATIGLYMNKGNHRHKVSALILNSPFLEMPQSKLTMGLLHGFGRFVLPKKPKFKVPRKVNGIYPKTLHKNFGGEWDYDFSVRPLKSYPTYLAWVMAVVDAHRFLQKKSHINVPILILHSNQHCRPTKVTKKAKKSDVVLSISDMKKYGKRLGDDVSFVKIKHALHDVFLSPKKVREEAFIAMFQWLDKRA